MIIKRMVTASVLAMALWGADWARGQAPQWEDLSVKAPMTIDAQIDAFKLKKVKGSSANLSTKSTLRFKGKQGDYEIRPGTDVLVEVKGGGPFFSFTSTGSREVSVGDAQVDGPVRLPLRANPLVFPVKVEERVFPVEEVYSLVYPETDWLLSESGALIHYVRFEWSLDGSVRWTLYAKPGVKGVKAVQR